MNKDPAFLFYSSDFLTGCMDLTMEERGQYITLICLQHQKGHLTEKTICLSVGNVSVDVMKKFKKDSDGLFYNERAEEEIQKRAKYAESRKKNGSLGGRPKKEEQKPYAKPYGEPTKNHTENENINEDKELYNKYFEEFWILYPRQRRGNKEKSFKAYYRAIKENRATPEQLTEAVKNYAISDEVKKGFAKGCEAWLNDDRFNNEYKTKQQEWTI